MHLKQGSQTRGPRAACGPRNYFVRPAALSMNLKIFRIKTTCIIHFTRKKVLFVLGPYLLTSTVLSRSRVSKLSVHVLYFSFQLQWEQCCVKQLHFVVRPADWLLPSTAAHMLRWVWDPWSKTSSDIKLSLSESIGSASKEPSHMREKKINASRFEEQKRRKIRRNIKKQPVRGDIQAGWWSNEDGRWHGMENCRRLLEALDCVLIRR